MLSEINIRAKRTRHCPYSIAPPGFAIRNFCSHVVSLLFLSPAVREPEGIPSCSISSIFSPPRTTEGQTIVNPLSPSGSFARSPIHLFRRVSTLSIDRYYYRTRFSKLLPLLTLWRFPQEENWVVSGEAKADSLSRKSSEDYVTASSFTRRKPTSGKRFLSVIFNNFDLSPGFYGNSPSFRASR